jgi:replicative DNA helicase
VRDVGDQDGKNSFDVGTEPLDAIQPFARMVDGGAFILDAPTTVPCIWGRGDEVIWAEGESLIAVGPPGVGKTTVVGQLTRARIGLADNLLGFPVVPTASRVLYLAMDRPAQIARSLRRHFRDDERATLTDRLVVWKGPPPGDLARHPHTLLGLARHAAADTVVIDSLKDGALGLTEDEVGAAYNRARQLALADGVQLVELHHMVKRGPSGAKPTTLADVYGSVWLTAGAGSVVLLWGDAGDPIVEWHHLKQPAAEVGPMQVIHDHGAGRSDIWHGTDLVKIAVASGTHGLTVRAAAVALFSTDTPTPAQIMKASRRLNRLVGDGLLTAREHSKPGGGKPEKVYHAAAGVDLGSNHAAITHPPADHNNHGADEQSRDEASSQVRAITPAITAITPQEQSRTAPL